MRHLLAQRRFPGWLAIVAILLASLAPTVSHALGAHSGAAWVEVCSAEGSKWVPAGSDESGGAPGATHLLAHCPGCIGHAPMAALPPAPPIVALLCGLSFEPPAAFLAAPRTLHAWISAQPRAPPATA